MKLTLGFSPCPNDTFIFDAMVNGKINTGDLEFDYVMEDVETLNHWAEQGKLDITKLSYNTFLSKPEALQYDVKADYVGFEVPNKFVLGYGLDYDGLGRNIPSLYELAE